jgi:D-alanyl-D-alanine carboxypeptidase
LQKESKDDPLKRWDPRELFDLWTGSKVQGEPGAEYEYSNAGYILLGILIEEVTGTSIQEFLNESITGPLKLENTFFPDGPDIPEPNAHGYDGTRDVTRVDPSWDFTAGGMVSTAGDLHVWARAFAEGELISPDMLAEQKTWIDIPGGKGEIKSGLGMEESFGWQGKNGDYFGWQADMYYMPEEKASFVVLMNKESSDGSDLGAVQQAFAGVANALVPDSVPDWYVEAITPGESK